MSTGHDTECPNCKGSGERILFAIIPGDYRIFECQLCCGTGLVELDESWEHG